MNQKHKKLLQSYVPILPNPIKSPNEFFNRINKTIKEKGILYVLYWGSIKILESQQFWYLSFLYYKLFKSNKKFIFNNCKYKYFYDIHGMTWRSERAIEIPIIYKFIHNYKYGNILEVGNVLSHYYNIKHDILDKYEKSNLVINDDVVSFHTKKRYDLIISISTLEHVGWDEVPREHNKILKAIKNMKKLLKKNGKIIITIPLGYNTELDNLLNQNKIRFSKIYYMKRISTDNRWIQVSYEQINQARYNKPFKYANAVIIGIL